MLRNRKGTALVLEQAFVVIFGIVILLMIFTIFASVRDNSTKQIAVAQFDEIEAYVLSAVTVAHRQMQHSEYGKIEIGLPNKVAGKTFRVNMNNNRVLVEEILGDLNSSLDAYGFSESLSGTISSSGGTKHYVVYNKTGNTITLEAI